MSRFYKIFVAIIVSGLLFASCDKNESPVTGEVVAPNNEGETVRNERVIIYMVDGQESRCTLETEAEWDAMLDQLCNQARNSGEIAFYNINQNTHVQSKARGLSKDSRTITTSSQTEIKAWMKEMEKAGLTVKVTYDDNSGTWSGVAYATAPAYNVTEEIVGTWHLSCMVVTRMDANGDIVSCDLFEPDVDGGTMYYIFNDDGTMSMTINGMDGSVASDNGTWTLSADGTLSCELLPNGLAWNVNWLTGSTLIMSQSNIQEGDEFVYYQIQFDAANNG